MKSKLFLFALVLFFALNACKNGKGEKQDPDKMDSVVQKLDSITDSVGQKIRDVNEGVEKSIEEIEDGSLIDSIRKNPVIR